eukprot:GGOE01062177.1.p1 GENE.GGOE01062177.1~~GGOE01062177.1.p1  ORF type:complete len:639 (+),score=142.06 GGOE01062177.1:124-2040(+)
MSSPFVPTKASAELSCLDNENPTTDFTRSVTETVLQTAAAIASRAPERAPTMPLFVGLASPESPGGSPSRSYLERNRNLVGPLAICSPPSPSSPTSSKDDSVPPPSSPKLMVTRERQHIESFNPAATKLRLQIDNLMKRAMAALAAGDLRAFQVTKARVGELQKALAEAELLPAPAPSFSCPDEEARMPPTAPLPAAAPKLEGEAPTPPPAGVADIHTEATSATGASSLLLPVAEAESLEITIPDCAVCYSQEEVQVAYGVCCKRRAATTKVYHRYHEFRALYDQLVGNSLAHALMTYLPAFSPFPGPKLFGSTNRSRRAIDHRRAALEAYLRSLAKGTPTERAALVQFLFPAQLEQTFTMKSLWRFSSNSQASELRLCIWPFEVRMYAGEEVLFVAETTPISRAEAALRYRVLLNFQQWAAETFPNDTLPTERNYQMFLHSPRALALPAMDDSSPSRIRRLARNTPSTNSHHQVAFAEEMCKHTVVRVVRNARRYVPPPAGSNWTACAQCHPRRRSVPEVQTSPLGGVASLGSGSVSCPASPTFAPVDSAARCAPPQPPAQAPEPALSQGELAATAAGDAPHECKSLGTVTAADLTQFPTCVCSDLLFCQVPGWPARYESSLCDVAIVVTPPPTPVT